MHEVIDQSVFTQIGSQLIGISPLKMNWIIGGMLCFTLCALIINLLMLLGNIKERNPRLELKTAILLAWSFALSSCLELGTRPKIDDLMFGSGVVLVSVALAIGFEIALRHGKAYRTQINETETRL